MMPQLEISFWEEHFFEKHDDCTLSDEPTRFRLFEGREEKKYVHMIGRNATWRRIDIKRRKEKQKVLNLAITSRVTTD